jgi:large subunit ribosomal protein L25
MQTLPHQIELHAEPRTVIRKRLSVLRRSGYIPANLYGPGMESIPLQVEARAFEKVARHATPTTMINLTVGAESAPRSVYLHHALLRPGVPVPLHLEFYSVPLERPIRAPVEIVVTGDSPAARASDAMLLTPVTQVHIEALPKDMPEAIPVDVSGLVAIDQAIHARDLNLPPGVTLLDDADVVIAKVQPVRARLEEVERVEAAAEQREEAEEQEERPVEGAGQ